MALLRNSVAIITLLLALVFGPFTAPPVMAGDIGCWATSTAPYVSGSKVYTTHAVTCTTPVDIISMLYWQTKNWKLVGYKSSATRYCSGTLLKTKSNWRSTTGGYYHGHTAATIWHDFDADCGEKKKETNRYLELAEVVSTCVWVSGGITPLSLIDSES